MSAVRPYFWLTLSDLILGRLTVGQRPELESCLLGLIFG